MALTVQQELYREYLKSAGWKKKRAEALAHYGPVCNRCGDYGTDVHHLTYERVGGAELMEDFEILCRPCHRVEHRLQKATKTGKKKKIKAVNVSSMWGYMPKVHKEMLKKAYPDAYAILLDRNKKACMMRNKAMELLGIDRVEGIPFSFNGGRKYFGWQNRGELVISRPQGYGKMIPSNNKRGKMKKR